jgi:hypothetical protein
VRVGSASNPIVLTFRVASHDYASSLLEVFVRTLLLSGRTLVALLIASAVLLIPYASRAQDFCPGDIDGDGVVTPADVVALLPLLFVDPLTLDVDTLLRADVNDDGVLSSADIGAIFALDGLPCPTPLPTAPPTSTPTVTPFVTPTPTRTRVPTPTPTQSCEVHQATLGSTNGTLSASDCQRLFSGQMRLADTYNITAAPGTAITVQVTAVAPLSGYLAVIDPAGQFESVEGVSPIKFTVTSGKPYQILVTSMPSSAIQVGDYTLTLTSSPCPTPVALSFPTSKPFILDGTECPEPGSPTVGTESEPTDVYTFTVTNVPTNVSITMQQLSPAEDIYPVMALLGPDGYELVSQDSTYDCTAPLGTLVCTSIRFLALQRGTYTILAGGSGGKGRYSMTVASPTCNPKTLTGIPPDRPLTCAGSSVGCTSTLQGDAPHTPCAAPLASPGGNDFPDPSSPAELYTFTALAGDVISVKMTSDDDPHLYLLGPAPSNALVGEDDSSAPAELAATLAVPGTYTIVAANNNALQVDDPPVNYTLLVQKCPVRGGLNPLTGRQVSGTFNTLDCVGTGDFPFRTYAFSGQAGQVVNTTMVSSNVDSFIRVFTPDGSHMENDDDLFQSGTSDARTTRILPMDGTYFVEVSASPAGPPVDLGAAQPPTFTLRARLCSATAAVPGQISGTLQDGDCDLGAGRTGDVYTFPAGATPAVATVVPPSNGCVIALLGDGTQVPIDGCSTDPIDVPVLGSNPLGFIVAGGQTSTRGAYTAGFGRCAATSVGFGDTRHGVLDGTNCGDPNGIRADWFVIQAPAGLVLFNYGLTGRIDAGFPLGALLSDIDLPTLVTGTFNEDPSTMLSIGSNSVAVLRVTGETPADRGAYDLIVDTASLRQ